MRDLLALFLHFLTTLARLLGPGGTRGVIAETLQLSKAFGIEINKDVVRLKPATLLAFHRAMKARKYRRLFSP